MDDRVADRPPGALPRFGVVGIGQMGLAMALRARDAGAPVTVHDVDAARETLAASAGCAVAASAAAVARASDVVAVVVVNAAQTADVLFAERGIATAKPAAVLLCPTIAAADTETFAARLAGAGIAVIDAPMSGGPARARAGRMSFIVACEDADYARWRPLLEWLASPVFRVGTRPGDGARTKLVNNLLAAVNLAGAAEALALAVRLGLDAAATLEVIEHSSGQSWIGTDRLRRALAGDDRVAAQVALLAKDSALATRAARAAGFATPVGDAAAATFARAVDAGLAAHDDAALWRWLLRGGAATQ